MWPDMYKQARIHYISRQHGVGYYDFDDVRIISVNTSDLPYELDSKGQKKYDTKITLAVREDQMEEIIEILSKSSGKKIIFMSHANPINRKGSNALKYNGRSLHELLVAFNQKKKAACIQVQAFHQNLDCLMILISPILKTLELLLTSVGIAIEKINTASMVFNIFCLTVLL